MGISDDSPASRVLMHLGLVESKCRRKAMAQGRENEAAHATSRLRKRERERRRRSSIIGHLSSTPQASMPVPESGRLRCDRLGSFRLKKRPSGIPCLAFRVRRTCHSRGFGLPSVHRCRSSRATFDVDKWGPFRHL